MKLSASGGIRVIYTIVFFFTAVAVTGQEVLLSDQEAYYDTLALTGDAERSYLSFRTLSDSRPVLPEGDTGPWNGVKKAEQYSLGAIDTRIYGPDLFASYNSNAPLGQNDGLLWQGRGANMSLSAGVRFEGYGFEATLKPVIACSQNAAFDLASPAAAYANQPFTDKAGVWGYPGVTYIDAPQRFGDDAVYDWSWGDSEIRYSWKTLTVGFGTQSIWLGPARINPLIHSNNAPPYPKFDIGARPTRILLFGKDFGTFEARAFWGMLSESDYFDSDDTNDENLLTGLSVSYSPPVSHQLVIGFHRTMLSKWSDRDTSAIFDLLWPFMESSAGFDERDQRASITVDYLIPSVGLELYTEWAKNDYSTNLESLLRYPFHAHAFTIGGRKSIPLWRSDLRGELVLEVTSVEMSQDFQFSWPSTFYAHHIITQGYTNCGQWIGAGMGTGGNSQYAGFTVYHSRGSVGVHVQRINPDNDVLFARAVKTTDAGTSPDPGRADSSWYQFKTSLVFGVTGMYRVWNGFSVSAETAYNLLLNPTYENDNYNDGPKWHNFRVALGFSYQL